MWLHPKNIFNKKDETLLSFYKALHYFRKSDNDERQYKTLNWLGHTYNELKHHILAIDYYQEILSLNLKEEKLKLYTRYNIARSLRLEGDYDSAIAIQKQLLTAFEKDQLILDVIDSHLELGVNYIGLENWDTARNHYNSVLEVASSISNNTRYIAKSNGSLGFIFFKEGEFFESEKYLLSALEQFVALDDPFHLVLNYNNLGRLYFAMGRHDLSIANYKKSIALNRDSTDIEQLMEAYKSLIFLSEQNGDSGQMLFYSTKLIELTTPFIQKSKKLKTLHDQHQAETTKYLIDRFEMEETLRIARYQNVILIVLLLSVTLIGFGYFLYRKRQRSDSTYIELMKRRFRILILLCQKYGLDMRALEKEYDSKYPK